MKYEMWLIKVRDYCIAVSTCRVSRHLVDQKEDTNITHQMQEYLVTYMENANSCFTTNVSCSFLQNVALDCRKTSGVSIYFSRGILTALYGNTRWTEHLSMCYKPPIHVLTDYLTCETTFPTIQVVFIERLYCNRFICQQDQRGLCCITSNSPQNSPDIFSAAVRVDPERHSDPVSRYSLCRLQPSTARSAECWPPTVCAMQVSDAVM